MIIYPTETRNRFNPKLTSTASLEATVEQLESNSSLELNGNSVDTKMIFRILVYAAASGLSIEAACNQLDEVADANTVREYINEHYKIERFLELEKEMNQTIPKHFPRRVRRGKIEFAVDEHDQPFYGKEEQHEEYLVGGKAKASTTRFYRIASLSCLYKGMRIVMAIVFVKPGMTQVEIVSKLLEYAESCNVSIKGRIIYFDRGFNSVELYRYLEEEGYSAVLGCPIRGKEGGGSKSLCKGNKSYETTYEFNSQKGGKYKARVGVARVFKHKEKKIWGSWIIYVLINTEMSVKEAHKGYRARFGIESSYKKMREARVRSNSRNPMLRFIYMALGLIMMNLWILIRYMYCQIARQGGRKVNEKQLPFHKFLSFLSQAVVKIYGLISCIYAIASPTGL